MLTRAEADRLIEIANSWDDAETNSTEFYVKMANAIDELTDTETEVETKTEIVNSNHQKCECVECGAKGPLYIHGACHVGAPLEAILDGEYVTIKCFICKANIVIFTVNKMTTIGI